MLLIQPNQFREYVWESVSYMEKENIPILPIDSNFCMQKFKSWQYIMFTRVLWTYAEFSEAEFSEVLGTTRLRNMQTKKALVQRGLIVGL